MEQRPEYRIGETVVILVIQILIGKDRDDVKVLFRRMGSGYLVPIILGKIRHTDPHFTGEISSLSGGILKITFNSGNDAAGTLPEAYLIAFSVQRERETVGYYD